MIATLSAQTDAMINISTSAQVAFVTKNIGQEYSKISVIYCQFKYNLYY